MDQLIANTYNERALLTLSEKQNGNAVIVTQHDDAGNRIGYLSKYPIDLTAYEATLTQIQRSDLVVYAKAKQAALVANGVSVNVAPADSAPKIVLADTDVSGRTNLMGLVALAQMSNATSTIWVQSTGDIRLNASEIITLGIAVGTFVDQTYATLSAVTTAINNGTITTNVQIDNAPWPKTS
jgi:hypothetical protein